MGWLVGFEFWVGVGCLNGRLAGRMSLWSVVGHMNCLSRLVGCFNGGLILRMCELWWVGRMFAWWVSC